ncbi:hypothetical protein A2V94_08945 [Candidatus Atribacteria bacterium RBG_16_35_8]|nr:MAG: hypothetical protein A2V94_08945 [Candidatus Atribacteria bacterium RBG_16_35_8]
MRDTGLLIITNLKNNLRSKIVLLIYIIIVVICVLSLTATFCLITIAPEMSKDSPDKSMLELYLGLIMYSTSLIALGVYINAFAANSLTREKSRSIIESLLATPLKSKDIWIARSIAIFIPGLIIGVIFTLIVMIAVNYIYFVPRIGFIFNPWIAVSSFLAAPLIYICLSFITHLIGLTGKPANANIIVQIFLPVFVTLMINLTIHNVLDINSWSFTAVNIGVAAIIIIAIIPLLHRLTNERIVLSS